MAASSSGVALAVRVKEDVGETVIFTGHKIVSLAREDYISAIRRHLGIIAADIRQPAVSWNATANGGRRLAIDPDNIADAPVSPGTRLLALLSYTMYRLSAERVGFSLGPLH